MGNKIITIKKNRDFSLAYSKGRSQVSQILVTYRLKIRPSKNLIGITTSKKIGNAVMRNRARRLIKEAYRLLEPSLKKGQILVFVARGKTPFVKSHTVLAEMRKQMKKFGLLTEIRT